MKVQWFEVHSKAKSRLSLTHLYQYNR